MGSVKGSFILMSVLALEKWYGQYDKTSHNCFHPCFSFTATELQGTIWEK